MDKKLAWILSRIFDPVVEIPLLLVASSMYALNNGMRWRFLLVLLVIDAVLPAVYLVWGLRTKRFSDWDISKRQQRFGLYFFTVFCHLVGVVLAITVGKYIMFKILLTFWLLAVIFAVITFFWKISVHAGVNGALVAFFNHFYGWDRYWWLVLILVAVLWSRVEIKKHSWSQVITGAALALAWVTLGLRLL